MFAFELQPWTTIQGASTGSSSPITQSEPSYLDTSRFLDLVIWLETKAVSVGGSNLFCSFQTSASKDESLFVSMNDTSAAGIAMVVGVQVFLLLHDTAQYPLMHWLRWQLIPPASVAWSVTFRIWASLSRPGAIVEGDASDASSFNNGFEGGPDWTDAPPLVGTTPPAPLPDITKKQNTVKLHAAARSDLSSTMSPFRPLDLTHSHDRATIRLPQGTSTMGRMRTFPKSDLVLPYTPPESKVTKK